DVGAAGDAAVDGDPAGVAAHDFDHDNPVVSFGRGMDAVNGFRRDVDRRVETEGEIGAREVIVDRLGNADHLDAKLKELLRDRESVVAANGDEGITAMLLQSIDATLQAIGTLSGVRAGRTQDGAAARENAADGFEVDGHALVLQQATPAFEEAE